MDNVINIQLYQNALQTWRNASMSVVYTDYTRIQVLKDLIEKGEFDMPRLGELDQNKRELWEELSEYSNLDRDGQIQAFVRFIKRKVPQRYWINLD